MSTDAVERIFTPLDRVEAKSVVDGVYAIIAADARKRDDSDWGFPAAPAVLKGLSIVSESSMREDEDLEGFGDSYESLLISVEPGAPPSEAEARERAAATGYAPKWIVLEPRRT
jgi:hypothetical protein